MENIGTSIVVTAIIAMIVAWNTPRGSRTSMFWCVFGYGVAIGAVLKSLIK